MNQPNVPRVTENTIRLEADARNLNLGEPIKELRPQIEQLRSGAIRPFEDAVDMVTLVNVALNRKPIARFSPFELLSRIHETVKSQNEKGDETCAEVSRPIHYYKDDELDEFVVKTPEYFKCPPNIKKIYNAVFLPDTAQKRRKELQTQTSTFLDTLAINRRLVGSNARCVKAREGPILCFKYNWLEGKLI